MENIFGIIMFIAFIIIRSMSDRKKGMTRGQKTKTVDTTTPKAKTKSLSPIERAGPSRMHRAETKPAPTVQKQVKPDRKGTAPIPPPFATPAVRGEGESYYDSMPVMEGTASPPKNAVPKLQPVAVTAVPTGAALTHDDLRRAVLWSEILGKPRAMRRSIR